MVTINADFSRRAAIARAEHSWVASPQNGVERMMLDRIGAERARATSLVRYRPESYFPPHQHPGGEEILVLEGTFSDETADYSSGWYLRNPPGSAHRPASREGALIFVKLWQMPADERVPVRTNTRDPSAWQRDGALEVCPLFHGAHEQVRLVRLVPGATLHVEANGGAELLLISGEVSVDGASFGPLSWWRLPLDDAIAYNASTGGATLYVKTGHLAHVAGGP